MRTLNLSKSGLNKILSRQLELKSSDFEDSINPIPPGEWCAINISEHESGLVFVNSMVGESFTCAHLVERMKKVEILGFNVEDYVLKKIWTAILKRKKIKDYDNNARLFYGVSDGLPGLLIDVFKMLR